MNVRWSMKKWLAIFLLSWQTENSISNYFSLSKKTDALRSLLMDLWTSQFDDPLRSFVLHADTWVMMIAKCREGRWNWNIYLAIRVLDVGMFLSKQGNEIGSCTEILVTISIKEVISLLVNEWKKWQIKTNGVC